MWSKLIDFYLPYAMKGDAESQFELAEIWLQDLGSATLAAYWYHRAALANHPDAAAQYAFLLLKQSPPNYVDAHYWATRASAWGSKRGTIIADFVRRIRPQINATNSGRT